MSKEIINTAYSVKVIEDINQLESLRSVWIKFQNHPNIDIDLFYVLEKYRKEIIKPYILTVYKHNDPVAMIIARVVDSAIDCPIGYKTIFKPRLPVLVVMYSGYIGEQSSEISLFIVNELIAALKRKVADAVFVNSLPVKSVLYTYVNKVPGFLCRNFINPIKIHHEMEMPKKREDFFKSMNRKHRSVMKKKAEKLEQDFPGKVTYTCFQDTSSVEQLCNDAEFIEAKSYHRGLGIGFTKSTESCEMIMLFARQNRLLSYILYIDNKPIAFVMGEFYKNKYYLDFMGYDKDFGTYSTGIILFIKVMEKLCDEFPNCTTIDFGFGDADYKQRFSTGTWEESSLYIFAPRLGPILINGVRIVILAVSTLLQNLAKKFNIETAIKKIWRNKAATQ